MPQIWASIGSCNGLCSCHNGMLNSKPCKHYTQSSLATFYVDPLQLVPKGPINNIPALVQIMAWCQPGDKPFSEPMMVSLLMHICVTLPELGCEMDGYQCSFYQGDSSRAIIHCPLMAVLGKSQWLQRANWNGGLDGGGRTSRVGSNDISTTYHYEDQDRYLITREEHQGHVYDRKHISVKIFIDCQLDRNGYNDEPVFGLVSKQ